MKKYSQYWRKSFRSIPAGMLMFAGVFSFFLMARCTTPPSSNGNNQMENLVDLTGFWSKIENHPCGEQYPDFIDFKNQGLYEGRKKMNGAFSMWDMGTYELTSSNELKISTANDAIVVYKYNCENNILSIKLSEDCFIKFRKEQ